MAFAFLMQHTVVGFVVLGSVFLALTGAEALYADMGHFGKGPIQRQLVFVALPALLLQYFGQGALLLREPTALANPFYHLAPDWMLFPLIGLATVATVIASQAMLSGAFSLTLQAVQLGYLPPLRITHTSAAQRGQTYVGVVNWMMFAGTVALVLSFGSSSNLAAAYGMAVSGSMLITTLLMYRVVRHLWSWPASLAVLVVGGFLLVDLIFFLANIRKIPHGGWFPLVLSAGIFTVMSTWARGRAIVADHIRAQFPPLKQFLAGLGSQVFTRIPGQAVILTNYPEVTPPALLQNVKHNKILHEKLFFLTVVTEQVPFALAAREIEVIPIQDRIYCITARCGFMESPDIPRILQRLSGWVMTFRLRARRSFSAGSRFWRLRNREWPSGGRRSSSSYREIRSGPVPISISLRNRRSRSVLSWKSSALGNLLGEPEAPVAAMACGREACLAGLRDARSLRESDKSSCACLSASSNAARSVSRRV